MAVDLIQGVNIPRAMTNKSGNRIFKPAAFAAIIAACSLLASCGSSGSTSTNVSVYKYAGSVQCYGGGTTLPAMQKQLSDARIQVDSASCGVDGNMYAAVCGAADGIIGIFEVSPAHYQAALALGFAPLSNLPAATLAPCQ